MPHLSPALNTEFLMLDESGVAKINTGKSIRLDFRTDAIVKSDVGLPDSAYGPGLVAPQGEKFQLVRGGVANLGIDQADAENWIESVKAHPEEKHEYVLSPGFRPGFAVSYDLRYDGSKRTQVIIVSVPAS